MSNTLPTYFHVSSANLLAIRNKEHHQGKHAMQSDLHLVRRLSLGALLGKLNHSSLELRFTTML